MIDATTLADAVILNDPSNMAGASSTVLVADVKQALDAWTTHLSGLGTLTVQVNLVNDGQNGLLASGGPTLDAVIGTEDGNNLIESGAVFELATGSHLSGGASDIIVNVNASYLSEFYLGGGSSVPSGQYDGLSLFEHEIAHGLGVGGETSQSGTNTTGYENLWDHDLANVAGTEVFTGTNATAVNGGVQVNVTTLNNGEAYGHIANSSSDPNANDLMTGLGLYTGIQRSISNLDLAILADTGAPITGMAGTVTIGVTSALTTPAGAVTSLGSLTLADTGAFTSSTVTMTLTDANGTLTDAATSNAQVAASSDGHSLTLSGSLANVQADLTSLSYTSTISGIDTVSIAVVDSFGNSNTGSFSVTTTSSPYNTPTVSSLAASADRSGLLGFGSTIIFTLNTTGPVTVSPTGTVSLTLSDGGTVAYNAAASTSTSLVFISTVASGQFGELSVTGFTLTNGATVTNVNGGDAALAVNILTPGVATGLVVDAVPLLSPGFSLANNDNPGSYVLASKVSNPDLTGVAQAGDKVVISDTFGGVTSVLGSVTADSNGLWTMPVTSALADGVHSLVGTAYDALGGASLPSDPVLVTIDTVAPVAPTLTLDAASDSGVVGDGITNVSRPTISGTAEAGSYITLFDDGVAVGGSQASSTGSWSSVLVHPLHSGVNVLTATSMDEASNVSAVSAPLNLTLDTSATGTVVASTASTSGTTTSTTGTTSVSLALPPPLFSLDGGQMQAQTYSADQGTHFAVVNGGTVSIVANASSTSSMTVYGNAGTIDFTNGGGSGLVVGTGLPTLNMTGGQSGSSLLAFTGTGATTYVGGSGTDEVISGGGAMSLTGGTGGSLLVFGGAGTLNLKGGAESDMVIGGGGAETIHAGTGAVFGGTGGSLLFANGAGTFLAGDVTGDQLTASSLGGDILVGGAGNETLTGAGSANGNIIFAGTGADSINLGLGADTFAGGMGSDTIQVGVGNAALYLGTSGASLINFTLGTAGGTDTISGFRVGTDHLRLNGYAKTATPTVTTAGGSTTVSLTDGTKIVLNGITNNTTASLLS